MTWIVLLVIAVVAAGAAGVYVRDLRPPHLRRRIILNLEHTDETALSGVLWAQHGPWLVLRDARLLRVGREPVQLDGEIVVERSKVAFTQVMP